MNMKPDEALKRLGAALHRLESPPALDREEYQVTFRPSSYEYSCYTCDLFGSQNRQYPARVLKPKQRPATRVLEDFCFLRLTSAGASFEGYSRASHEDRPVFDCS